MSDDEEYELTPHSQLEELKKEIERLKTRPSPSSLKSTDTLQDSIERLNDSVDELLSIFRYSKDHPETSESDASPMIIKKLDMLIDENRKIAQGIVALADMVKRKLPSGNLMQNERYPIPPPLRAPPRQVRAPQNLPPIENRQSSFSNNTGYNNMGNSMMGRPLNGPSFNGPSLGMPPPPTSISVPSSPPIPPTPKKKGLFG